MTAPRTLRHRFTPVLGTVAALVLVLAACTPEPPPAPTPPGSSRPECGSVQATAADGTAITVRAADGDQRTLSVEPGDDVDAEVRRLKANGKRIVAVAPEVPVSVAQTDAAVDDPFFSTGGGGGATGLYGAKRIDAPEAWGAAPLRQGQGVKVAVVDTGVQGDHPGLAGRVLPGIDLVVGAPYTGTVDGNGHGTHVAGTIAEADDGAGGIGVAPQAQILPVRVLGCSGGGSSSDVAQGIEWAVRNGADVINLSLGTGSQSSTILGAVEYALREGVVVVAAAGNGGANSCPPATPVTTTTSSSSTSSTTTASTPTTTSPPISTPDADPAETSTTTSTTTVSVSGATQATSDTTAAGPIPTAPTTDPASPTTGAPPPAVGTATSGTDDGPAAPVAAPSEPVTEEPVTIEAVVVPPCTPTVFSNALYPAGYAIGRPGLVAVAATGLYTDLTPATALTAGPLDWKVPEGSDVVPGTLIATVGAQQVKAQTHGVLVAQQITEGTTVSGSPVLAKVVSTDHRAPYSNVSQYVTVAAPGGALPSSPYGIYSTLPGSTYGYKSGTSMATPHVAGVAALVLGRCPALTPAQVANAITSTAEELGQAGWDPAFGAGMAQADAAVAAAC